MDKTFVCSICGNTYDKTVMNNPEPLLQDRGTVVCNRCNRFVQLARIYCGWCPPAGAIPQQTEKFYKLNSDEERLSFIKTKYNINKPEEITGERITEEIMKQRKLLNYLKNN